MGKSQVVIRWDRKDESWAKLGIPEGLIFQLNIFYCFDIKKIVV